MSEPIHILSLGAGVQSSTLALMAAAGEITPMPVAAVFADTKAEPKAVYEWLKWLRPRLPFPIIVVTAGPLRKMALTPYLSKRNQKISVQSLPVFIQGVDGSQGAAPRQCTKDAKITPVNKAVTRLMRKYHTRRAVVWIGISVDEVWRAKPSRRTTVENRWPLLMELRMNRNDCLRWMAKRGFPKPPRSACVFCPYRSNDEWRSLTPGEFRSAVFFERQLQKVSAGSALIGRPFLHRSMVPLDKVDLNQSVGGGQGDMFNNECEGMCGV